MKARTSGHTRDEALLINMADSIGSTLGVIAGRAHSVKKALSGGPIARKIKRDGRKHAKKRKSTGHKIKNQAPAASNTSKH